MANSCVITSLEGEPKRQMKIYLINFKKVNIINLETSSFHSSRDCNSGTNTHYSWINSNSRKAPTFEHSDIMLSALTEIYNESMKMDDPEKAEDLIEENEDSDSESPAVVKLTDVLSVVHPDLKVPKCLKNRYNEDSFFKIILEKQSG